MASVVISGDTSGSVTLSAPAVAGTTTLTLPSTSGTVLTTGSTTGISGSAISTGTVAEAYGGTGTNTGYYGFKNRIINGAMVIDQRNAGASITPTATVYSVDRWQATVNVASKASFDQTTTAPTGFTNSMLVTSLSAYSVAAGDVVTYRQQIEGFNIADLGWGTASAATITVSFWVRSSLTGTFGGSVKNGGSTRSYPFTYTISVADTWEQKTVIIAGDTTGTWPTDNTSGLILSFGLGVGSTTSGTAGAWAGANYNSATGATSVVGTNGATFYITGVQLEKGSTATSFDYRPYGTELQLCQRYYQQSYAVGLVAGNTSGLGLVGGTAMNNGANNVGNNGMPISFKVPMRATATVTTYAAFSNSSASITIAKASTPSATYGASVDTTSSNGFKVYSTATGAGGTAGTATELLFQYIASAEL